MANKKRRIPPSRARYLEKEPIISFHVPAPIKRSLEQQSEEASLSLAQQLLKIVTGEISAQILRERIIKNIIEEGKIEGYIECKKLHKEIENCSCQACFEKKISYLNLIIKSNPKR